MVGFRVLGSRGGGGGGGVFGLGLTGVVHSGSRTEGFRV